MVVMMMKMKMMMMMMKLMMMTPPNPPPHLHQLPPRDALKDLQQPELSAHGGALVQGHAQDARQALLQGLHRRPEAEESALKVLGAVDAKHVFHLRGRTEV